MISHWIGGRAWHGDPSRVADVTDPATACTTRQVPLASRDDVDHAVRTAAAASTAWADTPIGRRTGVLFAFRELVRTHRREIAKLITGEHGKTVADAEGEVQRGLEVVEFACGVGHLQKGDHSTNVSTGVDSHSLRQPLGVVAGITPFNFPAMVPMWMFPVAIACGNSFVLKPSEQTPSAALRLAELWREAGLPDGVFNVLHGDRVAAERLLEHSDVAAVSFVGSTPVARRVYETAAVHGKRVQALGGAKNHMVVLPDADIQAAADAAVSAAYGSAGERCMAISVLVSVGDVADRLLPAIQDRIERLRVGPGTDPRTDMGPLISASHRDRVVDLVEAGIREGADLVVDGRDIDVPGGGDGYWLGPCLFDDVTPSMSIYTDEIFGPVLVNVRVASLDDALELLASSPYGNGAAVFTRDGAAARRFEVEAPVGMLGVNVPIPVPMAYHAFGGWKQSLFGDTHVHGTEGVHFYTRTKTVTSRWMTSTRRTVDLGFPAT